MLIVPTAEFLGLLTDVLPFASPEKDSINHGVLIEWNGAVLSASAADGLRAGESRYEPNAEGGPDGAIYGVERWGPTSDTDRAGSVFVSLPDVKEIVKTFKLAPKFGAVPLNLKVNATGSRLIVERTRDTGKTQHEMVVESGDTSFDRMADLYAVMLEAKPVSVSALSLWGYALAAFEPASRRGPVSLFPRADRQVVARVGDVFVGYVLADDIEEVS